MARHAKYNEDLLLEAVVKYAGIHEGKIKPVEVAKWANDNIEGLEGVKYYDFTRKIIVNKNGKKEEQDKLCKMKIDELNNERSVIFNIKQNQFLMSTDIENVLNLPKNKLTKQIIEAREMYISLIRKNKNSAKRIDHLLEENKQLKELIDKLEGQIDEIKKEQEDVKNKIKYIREAADEKFIRAKLKEVGLTDGYFDIDTLVDSLDTQINFGFDQVISNHKNGLLGKNMPECSWDDEMGPIILDMFDEK